jgi:thiamine biosynthesis protein ThiI
MPAFPRASIVVHYAEIGTKGNNRAFFEGQLERNLMEKVAPLGGFRLERLDGRFLISRPDDQGSLDAAVPPLRDVFGVAWLAKVAECRLEYESIRATAVEELSGLKAREHASSFRVTAKRANKSFDMSSQQLAARLGEDLLKATGMRVDLSNPQATLFVDILSDRALIHTVKLRGPGGLPVGATGKVVHLLSGGIDSPVAAWLMMKRGCDPTYVHFYVAPSAEEILGTKMSRILTRLSRFGMGGARLVLVPFTEYQVATSGLRPDYEPVVFRHFMRLVAERVARQAGAIAISTGDNLGQVASQTLFNLACIDAGASMPILRPVLGYDKSEIIELAEKIGTYQDSIEDYKDCCSIVSRHPKTRMNVEAVLEASEIYDFQALADRTLSQASVVRLDGSSQELKVDPIEGMTVPGGARGRPALKNG